LKYIKKSLLYLNEITMTLICIIKYILCSQYITQYYLHIYAFETAMLSLKAQFNLHSVNKLIIETVLFKSISSYLFKKMVKMVNLV